MVEDAPDIETVPPDPPDEPPPPPLAVMVQVPLVTVVFPPAAPAD